MAKETTSSSKNKSKKSKKGHASIQTLEDAFIHELSDMHNAEKQLTKALAKMAKAANSPELVNAFETHLKETEEQIKLIDRAVKLSKIQLKREKCDAMEGLVKEGKEIIKNVESGPVRDALLISAAQKVEHYEIAGYGCLVATAKQLGFAQAAQILDQILEQEKQTDRKLNQIAEQGLNEEARQQNPTKGTQTMASRYRDDNRDRDEEARFMSDSDSNRNGGRRSSYDDYDDNRSYSRSSRSDYNDNDRSYSQNRGSYDDDRSYSQNRSNYDDDRSYSGRNNPRRDDEGRFMSDNDYNNRYSDRGYGSSSRGYSSDRNYDDSRYSSASNDSDYDDNRSSRRQSSNQGRGQGWFGDSEGHARAGRHSHDNNRSSGRR